MFDFVTQKMFAGREQQRIYLASLSSIIGKMETLGFQKLSEGEQS